MAKKQTKDAQAPKNKMAGKTINQSTQLFLDIAEIKNNTVIMKDGTLRAVMLVSSLNFALKSEDEQTALVSSYVTFLNYLDFPIQIVVQSRKLDISGYQQRLKQREKEIVNELLRRQIVNYQAFISELVELGEIMSKRFFVVIPYSSIEDKSKGFWARLGSVFTPGKVLRLQQEKFNEYKRVLEQRVEQAQSHLESLGLQTVILDTQSLIELYYDVYNPDIAPKQKLTDINNLNLE